MPYKVLVCQNKTCKQQGSAPILKGLQRYAQCYDLPKDWVEPTGCLGQCGNGPMVLVLESTHETSTHETSTHENSMLTADNTIWYDGVKLETIWTIARRYSGLPLSEADADIDSERAFTKPMGTKSMGSSVWLWVVLTGLATFFVLCVTVAIFAARHSHYV